ncbi:MAG: DUF4446 family protein [Lachnospiraceae bacterium]|nr:DUF4446 family protein [Lachnospiraceae bacterium]
MLLNGIGIIESNLSVIIIILLILLVICIGFIISLIVRMNRMEKKLKIFMSGKDGISLEQDVLTLHEENKYLKACADKNKKDIRVLYKKAEKAFAKIGLVKYDAFQQMGGKLSFSLALLDENNDGFIMNSVHGVDGCYSYTKAVKSGVCDLNLSKEEENALSIAIGKAE